MGWLSFLNPASAAGDVAGGAAKGVLDGLGNFATKLRSAITGDLPPEAQARLAEIAAQAEQAQQQGQLAINLEEAKSDSLLKSGWRPSIGWVCSGAIAYTYIVQPLAAFVVQVSVWLQAAPRGAFPAFPSLQMADILQLTFALLGLGALRTVEKVKGVS